MAEIKWTAKLAANSLSAEQKERLHEVADLLLAIYQTLVDMRYVDPEALIRGPHKLGEEILATYNKLGLDPSIIYLYSIMPYIDGVETGARDFFQGGAFFNPLSDCDVDQGRDPCYASPEEGDFDDENGEYMYPWYTPLSNCGNHSSIIIYDAKEHRIWIIDQIDRRTTDPAYVKGWYGETDSAKEEESNWGESDSSDWTGDDEDASNGSSEFWNDEDDMMDTQELDGMAADQAEDIDYDEGFEHVAELEEWERQEAAAVKNLNSLEPVQFRTAGDVLRDINRWYRELKELPGQGEYNGWMNPDKLRPLYLKNGWPTEFNGDAFEVDYARAYATERAHYNAEEPLREVKCYEGWLEYVSRDMDRHTKEISEAKAPDEEWKARLELWKTEERHQRNLKNLKDAREKAEKMCPGGKCQKDEDLPLWQLEQMRVETQWKREAAQRNELPEQYKDNPKQIRAWKANLRRALRKLKIYEAAFKASQADAECLCPGRTFQEATGIKSLGRQDTLTGIAIQKDLVKYYENYIQAIRDFAATVPQDAPEARAAVEEEKKSMEDTLKGVRVELERREKWLAEHGNTD